MSVEGEWEGRRNREFPEVHIHLGVAIFFFFFDYLFLFGLGLRCCTRAFSSYSEQGLLFFAMRCRGFSCGAQALGAGLRSRGSRAQLLCSMWSLPRQGIKLMCPMLAGGFLSTLPPGKSRVAILAFSVTTNACLKKGREKSKPPGTAIGHIRSRRWLHRKKAYFHPL